MYDFNSWDYRSDPEYLKGENEYLREAHYKLLSDSAELQRLGGMSRDERVEMRRVFDEQLAEHRRQVDTARAEAAKAEQDHLTRKAELDRDFRAAVVKYNELVSRAKTAEEREKALTMASEEFIEKALVKAERKGFWRTQAISLPIAFLAGFGTSLIYDLLKPTLFHLLRVGRDAVAP
jgi:uncharacterized protein involved in exopolysaccharide biosynthesis